MGDILNSDDAVPIIALIGAFTLGLIWTFGVLVIGFAKALRGGGTKATGRLDADEARSFQELERSFRRMEDRVEALETLIIDRSKKESVRREFE